MDIDLLCYEESLSFGQQELVRKETETGEVAVVR